MLFQRRCLRIPRSAALRSRTDSGWSTAALAILIVLIAGTVIAAIAVLGGGRQTVASRSAAAFDEARRKGIPIAEGDNEHGAISPGGEAGGHAAEHRPSAEKAEEEHTEHGEAEMPTHDDHQMTQSGAGARSPHTGMQHGTPAPSPGASQLPTESDHAGHGAMPPASPGMGSGAPRASLAEKSSVARPGQPAATLEPDLLDAPAATSELDAKRSAELATEVGSGGHGMMHGTGSYRQLDAGRDSAQPGQPTAAPHHHGTSPGSTPRPVPSPDTKRPRPAATPIPTPGGHVHPDGGLR